MPPFGAMPAYHKGLAAIRLRARGRIRSGARSRRWSVEPTRAEAMKAGGEAGRGPVSGGVLTQAYPGGCRFETVPDPAFRHFIRQ